MDEEKLSNAVNSVGFSNLNKIENRDGFNEKTSQNENFFRKGKTKEWLGELDPKIKSKIENMLKEKWYNSGIYNPASAIAYWS